VHGFKLSRPVINRPPILLARCVPGHAAPGRREPMARSFNWLAASDVAQCRSEVGEGKTIAARLFVVPTRTPNRAGDRRA